MSANIESLYYVGREKPWHGLGTQVDEAPNSSEAIKLAGLDWDVISNPVYDGNGIEIPGFKANTRNSDNSVLGIVSDKYRIVQNSEAFEFTDSLIETEEVKYETAGSLRKGKQIWLLAKMPERKILDDDFEPYICFSNTHDGTGAIKVCMTPIRVVCQNTLNMALNSASRSWSTKHMGDMAGKLHEAKVTLGLANKYMDKLSEEADKYANTKISDAEIEKVLEDLFPVDLNNDTKRKIENIQELKDNFYICYAMPDIAQYKGTQYGVINAMTDLVDHTAPRRLTANYQENNWGRIMQGHPFVDNLVTKLNALQRVA